MKTYSLFSFAGLLFGLLFLIKACPPTASAEEVKYNKDCFSDRATQGTLENQKGIVKKSGKGYIIFSADDDNRRFNPCNLEEEFSIEGLTIIFSGLEKEVFPNERWPGTPLVLQKIKKTK